MTDAIGIIKNFTALANATNIVAIVVEGLTSRDLVINAKEYPYLRKAVKKAQMYTNLKEPFDYNQFDTIYGANTQLYDLTSLDDLETEVKQIYKVLKNTSVPNHAV
jgi:hypothetical protein